MLPCGHPQEQRSWQLDWPDLGDGSSTYCLDESDDPICVGFGLILLISARKKQSPALTRRRL